jgi:hypothetical protein
MAVNYKCDNCGQDIGGPSKRVLVRIKPFVGIPEEKDWCFKCAKNILGYAHEV